MKREEHIKRSRVILLKLAEGITWQPYTELSEKKEYFTLEEASEALYQLHLEGVREIEEVYKQKLYGYQHKYNRTPKRMEYERHRHHKRKQKIFDNCRLCGKTLVTKTGQYA